MNKGVNIICSSCCCVGKKRDREKEKKRAGTSISRTKELVKQGGGREGERRQGPVYNACSPRGINELFLSLFLSQKEK